MRSDPTIHYIDLLLPTLNFHHHTPSNTHYLPNHTVRKTMSDSKNDTQAVAPRDIPIPFGGNDDSSTEKAELRDSGEWAWQCCECDKVYHWRSNGQTSWWHIVRQDRDVQSSSYEYRKVNDPATRHCSHQRYDDGKRADVLETLGKGLLCQR